jgi:hypothetical protein
MITTLIPAYKVRYIPQLLSYLTSQSYKKFRAIISGESPNDEVTAVISAVLDACGALSRQR